MDHLNYHPNLLNVKNQPSLLNVKITPVCLMSESPQFAYLWVIYQEVFGLPRPRLPEPRPASVPSVLTHQDHCLHSVSTPV